MKLIWDYLKSPYKALTFTVIGCGGTGSRFLVELATIAVAYGKLRGISIHVIACDFDTVSESNIGRQLFSESEIGMNKAVCLISKINRTYGLSWEASTESFEGYYHNEAVMSNFVVSCVDKVKSRKNIALFMNRLGKITFNSNVFDDNIYMKNFFWIDIGNSKNYGQIIIGSPITPNIIERYPDLDDEETDTPSCSLAEALEKQDLFVNKFAAIYAGKLVWEILTTFTLSCAGLFFNLETLNTKKIPIDGKGSSKLRSERIRKRNSRNQPKATAIR